MLHMAWDCTNVPLNASLQIVFNSVVRVVHAHWSQWCQSGFISTHGTASTHATSEDRSFWFCYWQNMFTSPRRREDGIGEMLWASKRRMNHASQGSWRHQKTSLCPRKSSAQISQRKSRSSQRKSLSANLQRKSWKQTWKPFLEVRMVLRLQPERSQRKSGLSAQIRLSAKILRGGRSGYTMKSSPQSSNQPRKTA